MNDKVEGPSGVETLKYGTREKGSLQWSFQRKNYSGKDR